MNRLEDRVKVLEDQLLRLIRLMKQYVESAALRTKALEDRQLRLIRLMRQIAEDFDDLKYETE